MCFTRVPQEEKKKKKKKKKRGKLRLPGNRYSTSELQSEVEQYISLKLPYTIIISNYFHIVIWHQYILWKKTPRNLGAFKRGIDMTFKVTGLWWFQIFFWKWCFLSGKMTVSDLTSTAEVTVVLRPRHRHPEMCPGVLRGLGAPEGSWRCIQRFVAWKPFQVSLILINNSCFVCIIYIYNKVLTDCCISVLLQIAILDYFGIFLKHGVDRDVWKVGAYTIPIHSQ